MLRSNLRRLIIAAGLLAALGGAYGTYEYSRWQATDAVKSQWRAAQAAATNSEERVREALETAIRKKKAEVEEQVRQEEAEREAERAKKNYIWQEPWRPNNGRDEERDRARQEAEVASSSPNAKPLPPLSVPAGRPRSHAAIQKSVPVPAT